MQIHNIYQAKTKLSTLVDSALNGEEVIIARSGKPVARLVAYTREMQPRVPGMFKGKIQIPDNFDNESKEITNLFYGGEEHSDEI
jgi:prevent-host-death family protein